MHAESHLSHDHVGSAVLDIARTHLGAKRAVRVDVEDDTDLSGSPGLRITIVLSPGKPVALPGDKLGSISLDTRNFLHRHDDKRFPFIHYATEAELAELAME